ncbi:hypothetical protein [Colwellia sp. Arc7-D]|uniref:hypothetical protein n=1 Tax=Colwellia sp. Arc7-D TaxID=2161872 RepID=UPI000D37CA71|nr:hypothetical protein [Colwellia sp. Arc7-D]AWB58691.1 hypothetical protein DBO93_14775 [Colwellia sp. Arc7-D]
MKHNKFLIIAASLMLLSSFVASAHDSHTHSAPWQACESKQKSAQCSYTNGENDLFKGSCQMFSETLMCVRNQPIIHADAQGKKSDKLADKSVYSE